MGPTVFILKNTSDTIFKVVIGDPQMCTCGGGLARGKLCHHILFIMLKVLRIPKDNPLSWQLSLMDTEVDQVLSGDLVKRSSSSNQGNGSCIRLHPFLRKGHGLKRSSKVSSSSSLDKNDDSSPKAMISVQRKTLADDSICCICQDEMTEEDMENDILCYCEALCGANFHRQCFRMYATYNRSEKRSILCPLCRSKWDRIPDLPNPSKRKSASFSAKKHANENAAWAKTNIQCRECNLSIHDEVHRCATCSKPPLYDLCRRCFHGGNYFLTPHAECTFVKREKEIRGRGLSNGREGEDKYIGWQPAISAHARCTRTRNLMDRELDPIGDYDVLLSLDDDNRPNIASHLLNAVKSVEKHEYEASGDMSDIVCSICSESLSGSISLKILGCRERHIAHESCVLQLLVESEANSNGNDHQRRYRGGAISAECPECRRISLLDSSNLHSQVSSVGENTSCYLFPHLNMSRGSNRNIKRVHKSNLDSMTAKSTLGGKGRANGLVPCSTNTLLSPAAGNMLPDINSLSLTGRTIQARGEILAISKHRHFNGKKSSNGNKQNTSSKMKKKIAHHRDRNFLTSEKENSNRNAIVSLTTKGWHNQKEKG